MFRGQYSIDTQAPSSYTPTVKKEVLSNFYRNKYFKVLVYGRWAMKKIFAAIFILFILTLLAGCAGPLQSAATRGDTKAIKEMLDSGADINKSDLDGTALFWAARSCQVEAVRLLLERGADANAVCNDDLRPLHIAAIVGCTKVVKLLIEKGADVNYTRTTRYGGSALFFAAREGHSETVRLLIESGADPDIAIASLVSKNLNPGAQLVEMTAKSVSKKKTQIAANREISAPTIESDIDELPAIKTKQNKNAYAIVIGIENYRQKLPKADFATQDAKLVAEYLIKAMGYPEENVITLLNDHASNVDLVKYFEKWLHNNVEKDSTVFIYFSGHGAPNTKTGDAYLVPYDGDPTFITETGYPIARLYESLGKLKAKEITVVLDSCFSGAGGRSVLAKGAKPLVMTINMPTIQKNISVMTASAGDQISSAYEEKGHGLFTYFMLKGIKNEDVLKQDGSIKLEDLFGYIKPQVERIARKQFNNEQTPQLIGAKKN
jgi:hypothetical protein